MNPPASTMNPPASAGGEAPSSPFADRIRLLGTENAFKVGPQIAELERAGHKVVKCNLGEPDFPLPDHVAAEVKRQIDLGQTHYCDPQGVLPLREAVAGSIAASRGIPMTPDRVVVFPGAKPPIGLCQQAYCNPGDEVVYPSPGFPIYESFTAFMGTTPVPLHLREENDFAFGGADLEPLMGPRTRLLVLNFPSNPTGGVATRAQLEGIAEVVRHKAPATMRIYSDEVYDEILFDGARHHSIASLPGMAERTIIVGGVSKTFAWTGGRVGWAAFPTVEEAAVFKNLNINYFSCVPAYNQLGAALGLRAAESRTAIAEMVKAFQERRDVVVAGLNAIEGIQCRTPGGAFYLFPNVAGVCHALGVFDAYASLPQDVRERTSPSTLLQMFLLWRYHVATLDRRSFGRIGADDQHYLRISIATAMDDLRDAVDRIAAAARDRDGFAAFVAEGAHLW